MAEPPTTDLLLISPAGTVSRCQYLLNAAQARTETSRFITTGLAAPEFGRYRFSASSEGGLLLAAVDVANITRPYLSCARDLPGVIPDDYDYAAFLALLPPGPWRLVRPPAYVAEAAAAALIGPGTALLLLYLGNHYELPPHIAMAAPTPLCAAAHFPSCVALSRFLDVATCMLDMEDP